MNFMFACGGTAGHINPALAIAARLRERFPNCGILFIGTGRELEKILIPKAGFSVVNIQMSGLRRGFSLKKIAYNINTAKNLITASREVKKLIKSFKPDVVIGTGGYVCYPVLRKAAKMKVPTIIHDSNAVGGLTTKMLSSIVDKVLVSFPNQEKQYKKPERVIYTGTPVRIDFKNAATKSLKRTDKDLPLVVSFWGSLGAERMNDIIADVIYLNIKNRVFNHIHAVGKKDGVDVVRERLSKPGLADEEVFPPGIEIKEYIENMPEIMARADLILCRGGGSTIAELMELKKPAIIIPSPHVANNEQEYNARQLSDIGGAIVLDEKGCNGEQIYSTISSLVANPQKLKKMSENIETTALADTTGNVVNEILSLVKV